MADLPTSLIADFLCCLGRIPADSPDGITRLNEAARALMSEAGARLLTLEACVHCDDASVRTAWSREARVRDLLRRLYDEVKSYGAIGHEGSELLEVMSEARAELDRKSPRPGLDA